MEKLFRLTRTHLLGATVIGCVVLLYYFNIFFIPRYSLQQHSYNQWLEAREIEFRDFAKSKPEIRIQLSSRSPSLKIALELDSKTYKNPDGFLRILQMVKAAALFDLTLGPHNSRNSDLLELRIESSSTKFHTQISKQDLSADIRLQNFVKLLEVYATEDRQVLETDH